LSKVKFTYSQIDLILLTSSRSFSQFLINTVIFVRGDILKHSYA